MKYLLLILLLCGVCLGFTIYQDKYCSYEYCKICDKKIYFIRENDPFSFNDNISIGGYGIQLLCDGEPACNLSVSIGCYLCSDCRDKYWYNLEEELQEIYNKRMDKIIKENEDLRRKHQEERRIKAMQEKEQNIKNLEKELKDLKEQK